MIKRKNKWGLEPVMSQREVALAMGISHGLVAMTERKAFAKIRKALETNPVVKTSSLQLGRNTDYSLREVKPPYRRCQKSLL